MTEPLRVLVVDDEVPLTGSSAATCERRASTVAVAHTGPDAVDEARATSARPDRPRRHAARVRRDRGLPPDPAVLRRLHHHAHRPRRGGRQGPRPVDGSRRLPRQAVLAARAHRPGPGDAAAPARVHRRARRRPSRSPSAGSRIDPEARIVTVDDVDDRAHPHRVRPARRHGDPAQGRPHPSAAHRRRVGTRLVSGTTTSSTSTSATCAPSSATTRPSRASSAPSAASATGWAPDEPGGPAWRPG